MANTVGGPNNHACQIQYLDKYDLTTKKRFMGSIQQPRDRDIEKELLSNHIISILWSMIVAQTDYVIRPNIIRQWSALDKELNKLKKFDSETFYPQHNLKMIECYYPESEQLNQEDKDQNIWGFKFEKNMSGQEYIDMYIDENKKLINLSPLVVNAPNSAFFVYTNFINTNGWIHTDASSRTKTNSPKLDSHLLRMNNEYVQITRILSIFAQTAKFNGIVRRVSNAQGNELEFTVGKDNKNLLAYYQNLKEQIGNYQTSLNKDRWHAIAKYFA